MNESSKNKAGRETIRLELSDNKRKTLIVSLEDMEDMEMCMRPFDQWELPWHEELEEQEEEEEEEEDEEIDFG